MSESPAIRAYRISTKILPEKLIEQCDRLKLLLQEKQAGSSSEIIDEEIAATADKLLE